MTLPLTIIGGYLGSGKTTLVNHLLRHADGLRLGILVNEFGALPIDEDLIEAQDEDIISIAGGCVCCSYGNDLTLALMDMVKLDPPPDHVILESSGVALPGAIAVSVSLLEGYAMDGIIVLTNAETIEEHARDTYISDTIERQLHDADLVVLNKTDLVSSADCERIVAWLSTKAQSAEIVEATHGALPATLLLQSFLDRDRGDASFLPHQANVFESRSMAIDCAIDVEALAGGLADASLALLRAKGFVVSAGGGRKLIQVVCRRWTVTDARPDAPLGLVVIGRKPTFDEDAVLDLISATALR